MNQENREVEEFCCRGDAVEAVVEVEDFPLVFDEEKLLLIHAWSWLLWS